MRAKQFIFEYNQAKTAQVFGNKLVTALANDKSSFFPNALGTTREFLRQKDKINVEVSDDQKSQIVTYILTALESADPTPTKEYTQWLAKCYANEAQKIEDITSKGRDWLSIYHQMKVKRILPNNLRNIANFKFSQLYDIVDNEELLQQLQNADEKAAQKNMPRGNAETVFETDKVRVLIPHDVESACYYGQGSQWCTAARNNNMFNNYNKQGPMYILLPKQPESDGEKYQLHFASSQFMDETDNPVPLDFLSDRFPGIIAFFKQAEPSINDLIMFADDNKLSPLLDQIGELALEHIHNMLAQWQAEDGYYYQFLDDEGYVSDDGDVDWEAVERMGGYLAYNDEARRFYKNAKDAVFLSPEEAKTIAKEIQDDNNDDELLMLHDLDHVLVKNVNDNIDEDEGGHGLTKFINDNIYITSNKETGEYVIRDLSKK